MTLLELIKDGLKNEDKEIVPQLDFQKSGDEIISNMLGRGLSEQELLLKKGLSFVQQLKPTLKQTRVREAIFLALTHKPLYLKWNPPNS